LKERSTAVLKVFDEVLGVDLGGVTMSREKNEAGIYPRILGSFEALSKLRDRFKGNLVIVSRVNDKEQAQGILESLSSQGFFSFTGISLAAIHFCLKREEKAPICSRLGVTHFIDDRLEVLYHLHQAGIKNLHLFQGRKEEYSVEPYNSILDEVARVESWQEVMDKLL
jgi:hypothetical protein